MVAEIIVSRVLAIALLHQFLGLSHEVSGTSYWLLTAGRKLAENRTAFLEVAECAWSFASLEGHRLFVNFNVRVVLGNTALLLLVVGLWSCSLWNKSIIMAWTGENIVSQSVEEVESFRINPAWLDTCGRVELKSKEMLHGIWLLLLTRLQLAQDKRPVEKTDRTLGNLRSITSTSLLAHWRINCKLFGMSHSGYALSYLLHLDLDYLVLQVWSFVFNVLLQDSFSLSLIISSYLLL